MSKTMQPTEVNYNVHNKELLTIIKALEEWEQYLPHFSGTPMIIVSDHQNLQYFMTARQVKPCHICWKEFLSGFNVKITYHPGKSSTKPNAFSQQPNHEVTEPQGRSHPGTVTLCRPIHPHKHQCYGLHSRCLPPSRDPKRPVERPYDL